MARALVNLLRNALLHSRSTVSVSLRRENDRTVIDVDDDGAGIDAADRERLFEPFVRQVARWHGGDAVISQSPLGGARVSIAW